MMTPNLNQQFFAGYFPMQGARVAIFGSLTAPLLPDLRNVIHAPRDNTRRGECQF
jgi:hypothetical protein